MRARRTPIRHIVTYNQSTDVGQVQTARLLAAQGDFVVALPRSGLPFRRPPATGPLGRYPGRTLTGKPNAACQDTLEVAAQEVEALPAFSEVYDPRLVRVQLQPQLDEDF